MSISKLKSDLQTAIQKAEHKPGEWSETAQSMGGICCPGEPFQIGKPWAKEEPWAHFSYKRDSWLAVAAVNALPALLAEIERLSGIEEAYTTACNVRNRLIKEKEALHRDAYRYRYMRDFPYNNIARAVGITDGRHYWLQFEAADVAVDKAMSDDCELLACMSKEYDQ